MSSSFQICFLIGNARRFKRSDNSGSKSRYIAYSAKAKFVIYTKTVVERNYMTPEYPLHSKLGEMAHAMYVFQGFGLLQRNYSINFYSSVLFPRLAYFSFVMLWSIFTFSCRLNQGMTAVKRQQQIRPTTTWSGSLCLFTSWQRMT